MFKNYLLTAWRSLSKQKLHSSLNILGLTVSLAACILMLLFAQDELSYDDFQPNAKESYRIGLTYLGVDFGGDGIASTPASIRHLLENQYAAEVKQVTHFSGNSSYWTLYKDNEKLTNLSLNAADSNFSDFFQLNTLYGEGSQALARPDQLLLSQSQAIRIFGQDNIVGRTLKINNDVVVTIAGVFSDMPKNSHTKFDALYSLSTLKQDSPRLFEGLMQNVFFTYIRLKEQTSADAFIAKLSQQVNEQIKSKNIGFEIEVKFFLQPLTDIHLHSTLFGEIQKNGSYQTVQLALLLALFLLLVACFNFINMATARSTLRAKEVGVRKALGATRTQLIQQFLLEAIMVVFISALLALVLVELLLPWFNVFTDKAMVLPFGFAQIISLLALIITIGVLAGSYPALFISSFNTVRVLSGDITRGKSSIVFRKILVCLQSIIAVVLIIMTTTIYLQVQYIKSMPLGYEREQVLILPEVPSEELKQNMTSLADLLLSQPHIISITRGEQVPTMNFNMMRQISLPDSGETIENVPLIGVDYDYLSTFGMTLVAGRDFSRDRVADYHQYNEKTKSATVGVIINESAAKAAGWTTPEQAIGKTWVWSKNYATIIGVVKDMQFVSAHDAIQPIFFALGFFSQGNETVAIKYNSDNHLMVKKQVEQLFGELLHMPLVKSDFLSARFDALYSKENKQTQLLLNFTGLILLITCIGLFGLGAFSAERRRKEVALRKVLGASPAQLVLLLSTEFSKLVIGANIIAWPLAYFIVAHWLQGFNMRIDIPWWGFVGASLVTFTITWLTVSGLAFKAATTRPINALRYE